MKYLILFVLALSSIVFVGIVSAVECGATPIGYCYVNQNTTFNTGTYNLSGININKSDILLDCNNSILIGSKQEVGIEMQGFERNIISSCTIKNYSWGIWLRMKPFFDCSFMLANNNNIIVNNILEDNDYGLISTGCGGIETTAHDHNKIINNTFINNTGGMNLHIFQFADIYQNTFENNSLYGIGLTSRTWINKIYLNKFLNSNASDSGINNSWNISGQGNYWSNYDTSAEGCSDTNSDLICDGPYNISGSAGSKDYLPTTGIQIWDIIPIQVIRDVDLVKGKTTLLRSLIKNVGIVNRNINASLYLDGILKTSANASINSGQEKNIDLFFIPDVAGSSKKIEINVKEI